MQHLDLRKTLPRLKQDGINMVDLMMWLVIAALLLAAAIQGIGFYQKAAFLRTMSSDASGAGSVVMGTAAAGTGSIDLATVQQGAASTTWSTKIAHLVQEAEGTGKPYIRVTHPQVTNLDVVYLFAACGEKYKVGVNIVPKDSNVVLEECGIGASPGSGGSGGGLVPTTTPTMVSVWDTSLPGCTTIILPVSGTINANVDWGDGVTAPLNSTSRTHAYAASSGPKTVTINGTFTKWGAMSGWTPSCITEVKAWGTTATTSLNYAFNQATNLTAVPQIPAGVTDTSRAFQGATKFNGNVNEWDVSKVTDMQGMFYAAYQFNQPLDKWKTTSLENASDMFLAAKVFNQPIGMWDTSRLKYASGMFSTTDAFDQPLPWNTSSLMYAGSMFRSTKAFNQDLKWETSKVVDMSNMFNGAAAFNGDISGWNTGLVTNMTRMFNNATVFNRNLSAWNTSQVTNMMSMFENAKDYDQPMAAGINGVWNTAKVTDMAGMFSDAASFNQPIGNWDTGNVTNMSNMFFRTLKFNQDISGWNTAKVTTMGNMFYGTKAFNRNISGWNVGLVTNWGAFRMDSVLLLENIPLKFR